MTSNIKDFYQIADEEQPHHDHEDIDNDSHDDYDYLLAVAAAALLENEHHAFASALSHVSARGVRKTSTAIRLMLDSGAKASCAPFATSSSSIEEKYL